MSNIKKFNYYLYKFFYNQHLCVTASRADAWILWETKQKRELRIQRDKVSAKIRQCF